MKTIVCFGLVLGALSAAGRVIVANLGQTASLECVANAYTSNLEWLHGDNRIIGIDGRTGFQRKGSIDIVRRSQVRTANLEISRVEKQDAGKFTCKADGKSTEHTLVVFSVSVSPSGDLQQGSNATLNCQVYGLSPGFTVKWESPAGTVHTGETVTLKSVSLSDNGAWVCKASVGEQTADMSLQINIEVPVQKTTAAVPSRITKKSSQPADTKPPTSADGGPLGLSRWMWIAVGVGCLIVVLLMVVVICLCRRIRRRRRKLQKNGHQPLKTKQYCQCNRLPAAPKPQQRRRGEKPSAIV